MEKARAPSGGRDARCALEMQAKRSFVIVRGARVVAAVGLADKAAVGKAAVCNGLSV